MLAGKRLTPSKRRAANRKTFTDQNVMKLRCKPDKQYLIWDAGTGAAKGLAILVSPQGAKSFRCVFYYPGSPKPHWRHLGRVGEMKLAEARELTGKTRAAARRGEDPRANDGLHSDSFKVAVENYIQHEQIGKHGNTSAPKTQQIMLGNTREWHQRPVATIRYQEIESVLRLVRDADKDKELKARPYLANRLFSHFKDFFGWCVRSRILKDSPMTGMEKPWDGAKRRTRDWFKGKAADEAIKALWKAADEIGGTRGSFVKMLLLTGKRKGALAAMRWEEIGEDWFWNAPESKSKNKRLHAIPLPKKAQQILHPRQQDGLVFGKLDLDRLQTEVRARTGIDDFIWHGTRHLLESKTAELKVPPHIRDSLFDHVPARGSGAVYDHHEYRAEMLAALETLARHINGLVASAGTERVR